MHFTAATAISFFSLTLSAAAAVLQKRNIDTGFWQVIAKNPGDSSSVGIPLVLGPSPDNSYTYLSTGAADEVPLCIQLLPVIDPQGLHFKGAKVINHPTLSEDLYMWQTNGGKYLMTSTRINIGSGIRGNWTFVNDPAGADFLLDLEGDTVAKQAGGAIHFGSHIPLGEGGELISLVGVPVLSC